MISIIVPAFNEEQRIKPFLKELKSFLKGTENEIIVVNDGSIDRTSQIAREFGVKVIDHELNLGKGSAIKNGVDMATGEYIVFIDADGSIHPSNIKNVIRFLKKYDIVAGSKFIRGTKTVIKQPIIRDITAYFFDLFVDLLFHMHYSDYLCGCKGFRKDAAKKIFPLLKCKRWIFDVEIFLLADNFNFSVKEIPITWSYMRGSKIMKDIPRIFINLLSFKKETKRESLFYKKSFRKVS
jgi:dolichyl-phosphate beta-glucosyltransferase